MTTRERVQGFPAAAVAAAIDEKAAELCSYLAS